MWEVCLISLCMLSSMGINETCRPDARERNAEGGCGWLANSRGNDKFVIAIMME